MARSPKKTDPSPPERDLEAELDRARLPRHIAIIPDGNGRWARQRGFADRVRGHEAGFKAIRDVVETCVELGVDALSIYAFSRDNWQRSRHETSTLMRMLRRFLISERGLLKEHDVRLIHTGRREDLPRYVTQALDKTLALTADNAGMTLNLCVSYSGRLEISDAARRLAEKVRDGEIDADDITPDAIAQHLYAPQLGDPDLLIRTSGERRISDFLTWQLNYSELHFTDVYWPDFRRAHLVEALVDYQSRQRRFGTAK